MTQKTAIAACALTLKRQGEAIQLFPAGEFSAPRGALMGKGPWRLDGDGAGRLIAACAGRSNDILIDYEHQSLTAYKAGHTAPAAGWIKPSSLVWQDDGLYAQSPDWKDKAAAMIAADEYRYLSPVFTYDTATGTPLTLVSVALTNTPAIDGMAAVSLAALTAALPLEEPLMEASDLMERLCYLLNLPLTITPAEMLAELDKLKGLLESAKASEPTAAASLPALLQAKDAAIAALKAAPPDPAQYVPMAALLAVQEQYRQAAGTGRKEQVAALIAANPKVIVPALVSWATALGEQDIGKLEEYINNAAPIAALTAPQTQGKIPEPATGALNATELAVCSAMGISPEQFKQTRDKTL